MPAIVLGFSLTPPSSLARVVLVCETLSLLQLFVHEGISEVAFFVNPDHSQDGFTDLCSDSTCWGTSSMAARNYRPV
jgi:hypothetical protein